MTRDKRRAGGRRDRRGVGWWRGVLLSGLLAGGFQVAGAETATEVRRAVRVTVRLGEPAAGSSTRGSASEVLPVKGSPMIGSSGGGGEAAVAGDGLLSGVEGEAASVVAADREQADLRMSKRVVISLDGGVLYDDNIFLNARDRVADVMWRAGVEARLNFGDVVGREDSYAVVRYRPDAYFFHDNTDENTVDHDAGVIVRRKFAKLAVDASGTYQRTSGSTVELGDRVERDVMQVRGGLTYGWTAKTSVSTAVQWDATAYREGVYDDFREWVHEGFGDYQATEKFKLGLGGGYGQLDVDDGSAIQDFQRALMRLSYGASGKFTLSGRAGLEFRQTEVGDSTTPVFGLEASHALTAKTSARMQGTQEVAASGAQDGQNYIRTGLSLGFSHQLSDRLALSMDGGWERYDYEAARRGVEDLSGREDTNVFLRPGFTYAFGDRWKAEAWYQWRSSDSTDPGQAYEVNQAGFNVSYTF